MREIRFKAYHKEENKICEVNLVNIDQGCYLLGAKPGKDQIIDGGKSYIEAPKDGRFCYWHEIELMQFTGLTDKNGNDVFEGDIIEGKTLFRDATIRGQVVFTETGIWKIRVDIYATDVDGEKYIDYADFEYLYELLKDERHEAKIIGNIYEHPELLTNKK